MTMQVLHRGYEERRPTAGDPSGSTAIRFVDLHCHCLPYLDDGPDCMEAAAALCRALVADHVCTVVATPHQLGRFERATNARKIRLMVQSLNQELSDRGIDLRVLPGAEIRLDERLDRLLAEDEVLTIADRRRHVLLELPHNVFIDIEPLALDLRSRGLDLVMAHPERNLPLLRRPEALQRWLDAGVALQVTAASVVGDFGQSAQGAAWSLIREGCVTLVATDAHDHRENPPRMTAAFEMIAAGLGRRLARLLCEDNPARVLRGERLIPGQVEVG